MDAEISELTQTISQLLDEKKYKEALSFANSEKFKKSFKSNSWEVIPVVVSKIKQNTLTVDPQLYSSCETLLKAFVDKGNPEEILLELIEQVETAKNYAQFSIVLHPMQNILVKLKNKRNRSLEWCFNAISIYIGNLSIPEYNLEGKERLLLDNNDNIRIIEKVFMDLPDFYNLFIEEVAKANSPVGDSKKVIAAFLIGLLGKPMIYIDIEPETAAKSAARKCCETTITDLCKLEKDVLKFLNYVEYKYQESSSKKNEVVENEETDIYLQSEKLSLTSLSGLFYVALSGHFQLPDYALPQIYNTEYIVRTSLLCVQHLLSFSAYSPLTKGISLCKALFARLSKPVSREILVSRVYTDITKSLVNTAVFSNYEKTRKEAVSLIGQQVTMFEYKGRCSLIKCLLNMANHSGLIGYAITLFKNSIEEVFKSGKEFPECFVGEQMFEMLKKIVFLPHGAESDLVELADQIITALNFIIYITQRDTGNVTRIHDYSNYIQVEYLDKLRIGLNMSKAHYQVKLNDINEGVKSHNKKIDVSINVGGNILDDIPLENQKEVINSALNAFHLTEGLLARAQECIDANKMKI